MSGQWRWPIGIPRDEAGNLYVTDTLNNHVQVFNCNKEFLYTFSKRAQPPNS